MAKTNRKSIFSMIAVFFIFLLVVVLVQNYNLNSKIEKLSIESQDLIMQLDSAYNENMTIKNENIVIKNILSEEKKVADNYRTLVGEDSGDEIILKAKQVEESTPLDFETAYIVVKTANEFDLNVSLILSVMDLESNFNQYAVGTSEDRGYMQIIPSTEKWLAEKYGYEYGLEYNPDRIFDPEYNIGIAAIYLNLLQNAYGDNYNRILSEYNRGPSNLKKYYEENNTYETTYSKVILSKEVKYLALND